MQQLKRIALAVIMILAVGLVSWPVAVVAGETAGANTAPVASTEMQGKGPGNDKGKGNDDKAKGDKDKDDEGNDDEDQDDKANTGRGNNGSGAATGNATFNGSPPSRRLGAWWRAFRSRWFQGPADDDFGGWQLGRFKNAFPFAYPQGWQARERGDALVITGPWQGADYIFQLTRTVQVDHDSLRDWVENDLDRLDIAESSARFAEAERTQVAVVTGVNDPAYDCPVAYVYLWTQNPAGNNQRQAMAVISQAPGSACNPAALNAFVDQYLARMGAGQPPLPLVTPTAAVTPRPGAVPTVAAPAATPGQTGWQQTRFFNAFSFAYPPGWRMDRLGDTAHLQGDHEGGAFVMDVVWVRNTPQAGLEQWVRADLADLGAPNDAAMNYIKQGDAQIAVVPGVRMTGYACPVVRFYVMADNPAGDGPRAYSGTLAQANGQACDPTALENLAYQMLQQA